MMKNHGLRRFFSLLLALFMVFTLLPTTALAEDTTEPKPVVVEEGKQEPKQEEVKQPEQEEVKTPADDGKDTDVQPQTDESGNQPVVQGSKPVTITVRVFVPSTGVNYTVGTDTAGAGKPGQIQSADYKIPQLTKFVDSSKFGKVTGVYGNWYFPGTTNLQPGTTIQWSTNSGTGTMTYYVDWYNPDGGSSTTYLWNFTLKYDANGGTGAPADQTWGTNDKYTKSHTFNIPNTVPTREGYVFKGWSDTKGGSATRQPGGTCLVSQTVSGYNGGSVTKTLYAVWEEATPPKPDKPTAPGEDSLSGLIGNITVNCTNGKAAHEPKTKGYALIPGSYTPGEVEGDAENGYTCTVTINSQKYVYAFDGETNAAHDPKDASATVTLKHTDNGWTVTGGTPVVFNVACVTEIVPPAKPGAEDLAKLEAPVEVVCTTKPETHTSAPFALIEGTYTVGDVLGNETDGYTCDINITADEYVTRYKTDFGAHTLSGDPTKTLTLKYVEGRWISEETATFYVECVEELFPVKLVIYRNGDTSKAYTTVSLESQPKGHVIDLSTLDIGDYYTANYTGKYDFYGWYNDGTWNVYKKNLANPPAGLEKITVNGWTNIIGMVHDYEKVVYFQSAEALKAYQGDHSKTDGILYSTTARKGDTLPTADAPTATRTGYTFKFWSREGQSGDVTGQTVNGWTNLYANWEKNIYTVTYTDGVNGKAFADQVYNVPFEDATPAFEGTPTRKGFVFDGWNPEVAETVTDNATYTAQWKPVQPDKKAIEGAIGRGVAVVCDNQNVNHGEKKYKPTLGEYTVSDVMGTAADGYTCTVTVKAAKFIEKYNSDMGDAVHTLIAGEPAEKTIELKWNGEKWVAETELPVTFHTLCPPEQPSKKDIEGAIGRGVKIVCDNQNVNHWGKDYKPTQGEYTVSDVTGTASEGYTCTITVKAAKIIEKYSSDMGKTHALIVGEQAEKTVELKWNGEKWVAKTELPITFHVECPPEKPTYDELKGLGINAKVDCTTTTAHNGKSYTLIEDTYNVSDPERKGTAYTCILTVNAKDYVAKYNAEENVGPHALDDRDSKTIELTWNGEKWTAAETSVTFNVKCELLTVTYTDGVKGEEVFADVVYKDIPYGTSTPAFGTKDPTREGYKFVGWEPEVAETVTKNVTYTAKWEKLYTVTYTDGAKGKAFKDQVYKDLESGTDTPKFDGKPTRKGYTFTGWSPKVTDTVTKDVTYVAQWKSVKNGKDNIPKTGDSEIVMVLGSVLLFSFCGAAAVSVYDRKRKHF